MWVTTDASSARHPWGSTTGTSGHRWKCLLLRAHCEGDNSSDTGEVSVPFKPHAGQCYQVSVFWLFDQNNSQTFIRGQEILGKGRRTVGMWQNNLQPEADHEVCTQTSIPGLRSQQTEKEEWESTRRTTYAPKFVRVWYLSVITGPLYQVPFHPCLPSLIRGSFPSLVIIALFALVSNCIKWSFSTSCVWSRGQTENLLSYLGHGGRQEKQFFC